jgi:hypothetical protein
MTVTNNYSLQLPLVGGDLNVWGGELNNGAITIADNALGGTQATAITSADVTITTAQFANAIFVVTGALTGNRNLIIPFSPNSGSVACAGRFVLVNNTTGAFNLSVITQAAGSVGVTVPQGFTAFLYSDGTNVGFASRGLAAYVQSVNGNPNGQLAGTAGSVNTNASLAFDYTNGNFWICTTTGNSASAVWSQPSLAVRRGFDTAINLQLIATVPGNNLTVTLAAGDTGLAPTVSDPITVVFPSNTGNSGAPVQVNVTIALSIATATGASFGSAANTPFRLWYVLFYNGGTPVLGVINCSTPTGIFPLNEARAANSVLLSGASTSAGVFYTPGGTVANSVFRILGFIEYEGTTLVTPGTYTSVPDWVRLFGPGVKKPGDVVQIAYATNGGGSTSSGSPQTLSNVAITPTSKSNLVLVQGAGQFADFGPSNVPVNAGIYRGSTLLGGINQIVASGGSIGVVAGLNFIALDAPGANTSQTYAVKYFSSNSVNIVSAGNNSIVVQEIMG